MAAALAEGGDPSQPAMAAAMRESELSLPLPYLPSLGAVFLLLAAVLAHILLGLGNRWSVRCNAW